jgi:hypothetical protein
MTKHLNPAPVDSTPFAEPYIGRHRAPEPDSIHYYAPARTMGTLAELVGPPLATMMGQPPTLIGPVEENRTSIIDITDRTATEVIERVEFDPPVRTRLTEVPTYPEIIETARSWHPSDDDAPYVQPTGSHRAEPRPTPRWVTAGWCLAALLMGSSAGALMVQHR